MNDAYQIRAYALDVDLKGDDIRTIYRNSVWDRLSSVEARHIVVTETMDGEILTKGLGRGGGGLLALLG